MPIWRAGVCAPPEQLDLTVLRGQAQRTGQEKAADRRLWRPWKERASERPSPFDLALAAEVLSGYPGRAAAVRDCSALADPAELVGSPVDSGCSGLADLPWLSPSMCRATSLQDQSRPLAR